MARKANHDQALSRLSLESPFLKLALGVFAGAALLGATIGLMALANLVRGTLVIAPQLITMSGFVSLGLIGAAVILAVTGLLLTYYSQPSTEETPSGHRKRSVAEATTQVTAQAGAAFRAESAIENTPAHGGTTGMVAGT